MVEQPDREAHPIFSKPIRQIVSMILVLLLVALGIWVALPRVLPVFLTNTLLNGLIGIVFLVGVAACFWQIWQMFQSVTWIEGFVAGDPDYRLSAAPRLLAPLAALLRSRGKKMQISATSSRSILDSVATRIDEARDITRYIVNLLIFLGLLGTFYGLATTVPAIVDTIRNLAPADGEDSMVVFSRLIEGLQEQLGGMGVAFASSLLGLAGSLVVGLLELFASHGQNRFYRQLEEWLSSITRIGFAGTDADTVAEGSGVSGAVLTALSEQLDRLEGVIMRAESNRAEADASMARLADAVTVLAENSDNAQDLAPALDRVVDGQDRLADALAAAGSGGGLDSESRMRLRSIDVQLLRVLEELSAGRQESTAELRQELRQLARAMGRRREMSEKG